MFDRRTMILGSVAAAFVRLPASAAQRDVGKQSALRAARMRPGTLAAAAAKTGLLFGTCAYVRDMIPGGSTYDPSYTDLALRECSLLVPGYGASPDATRKTAAGFDFSLADPLLELASKHDLAFAADHLVWHDAIPAWVRETLSSRDDVMRELLLEVTTPVTHFANRVYYWVVCNEVINTSDGDENGLRKSFWFEKLGPEYIPAAFRAARAADPNALLLVNEYDVEADHPYDEKKRTAFLNLVKRLRNDDVPIDGVGLQAHLRAERRIDAGVLRRFLDELHALGLKIFITELDVQDTSLPADTGARDAAVSSALTAFLQTVVPHPGVQCITAWGLSDNHSWYNVPSTSSDRHRADGLPSRGTLFDDSLHPKAAYDAVRTALRAPRNG